MHLLSTLIGVFLILQGILAQGNEPGYAVLNGATRLEGSSFGLLGINKTFDYVVRS
jgi:hypothetical protein